MKKIKIIVQSFLFGYREPKGAKTVQGGSHIVFEGGSPKEKFNAMLSLKNELKQRQIKSI